MFGHAFQTNKTISTKKWNHQWTINIFIHFTTESQGLMRFPHQYPPPRPRPERLFSSTAAFASRSRSTTESWPSLAAMCSGVLPREPQPEAKPRAEPNGTKGRKIRRKFWAPQKSKFWKLWVRTLWFWGCFDDIELVEKTVAFGFLAVKMSWIKNKTYTPTQEQSPTKSLYFILFENLTGRTSSDRKKKLQFESRVFLHDVILQHLSRQMQQKCGTWISSGLLQKINLSWGSLA